MLTQPRHKLESCALVFHLGYMLIFDVKCIIGIELMLNSGYQLIKSCSYILVSH